MRRGIRLDDLQVALVILPPLEKGSQGGLGIRNPPKSLFKKGGLEPVRKTYDRGNAQKLSKEYIESARNVLYIGDLELGL